MILQKRCDNCGFVGTGDEIQCDESISCEDLCSRCMKEAKLRDLRERRDEKQKWLDECHLKDLRDWDEQIKTLENDLAKK